MCRLICLLLYNLASLVLLWRMALILMMRKASIAAQISANGQWGLSIYRHVKIDVSRFENHGWMCDVRSSRPYKCHTRAHINRNAKIWANRKMKFFRMRLSWCVAVMPCRPASRLEICRHSSSHNLGRCDSIWHQTNTLRLETTMRINCRPFRLTLRNNKILSFWTVHRELANGCSDSGIYNTTIACISYN